MKISENMNLHQWAKDMAEQKASGLTRKQWCELKGMQLSTYDYRCKRVRNVLEEKLQEKQNDIHAIVAAEGQPVPDSEPVFAKVNLQQFPLTSSSGVNIRLSGAEISIAPDTPAEHVRMVLEVLAHAQ